MDTQTLQIDRAGALRVFNEADANGKALLKKILGDEPFGKITDRVNNFDDILAIAGTTMEALSAGCRNAREIANRQVELIAEVYNEGTVLDPMDTDQYKYYPWFHITPGSGFGLSFGGYGRRGADSSVGVRLCYKSRELAIDVAKKFIEIYANLLIK